MKFYNQLARLDDHFIDWEQRIKNEDPFFQHLFRERLGTSILDLGCGSGGYSIYLAEMGYNVIGIDSASEMIQLAQEKASQTEVDIEFQCLKMTDFANKLQQQFDAIICNGNTLSHLLESDQVLRMFQECAASLKPTGAAIFHILNYKRILEHKRRDFPVRVSIEGDQQYIFSRFYDYTPTFLEFNMVAVANENGEWYSRSMQMMHRPWLKHELVDLAKKAGFNGIMTYGDFRFSDFDPDQSDNLILVCEFGED